ncbi:adenosylcobinamide amidohydrolase [Paenibacillus hamazuiensis]|uniref:adenosylcobinamide amidohydrolase n=1 Tax=Paenibacillus hamazuiensis TaxID=2936508 RepID=UPI00200F3098|nr:adenosylcobinamide amidohydrolase [Paenibacillus hamazuiensis]
MDEQDHNRNAAGQRELVDVQMCGVQAWCIAGSHEDGKDIFPYLLIETDKPVRTLNSSPWGGGFGLHRCLVNRQVDLKYDSEDPNLEMLNFLKRQQLNPQATTCLMTAARVADAAAETAKHGDARVAAIVTAGFGNKARAGFVLPNRRLYPGTINTIVLVQGSMTDAAMVNAVITATEAKAAALQALDERVAPAGVQGDETLYATGTTTDAVLIASIGDGPHHRYAGTATEVGYLIGKTVFDSTVAAGRKYRSYAP